ncbi:MAG: hypothetical protein WDM79_05515 [Terricaulis sp.]
MNETGITKRLGALIAIIAATIIVFAGGLALMNVRADWALALGAALAVAGPVLGIARLWAMLREDQPQ